MDDLQSLLRSAERPRELTETERDRILARLARPAPETPTIIEMDTPAWRGPASRWQSWQLAVAASIVVVLVLGVAAWRVVDDPSDVAAPPPSVGDTVRLPSVDDELDALCRAHVDPLAEGLERWRGVENWAWADAEPDLGQLVNDALLGFSPFEQDRLGTERLVSARTELRDDLAQIASADVPFGATEVQVRRAAAVNAALDVYLDVLADLDSRNTCDEARLGAAR